MVPLRARASARVWLGARTAWCGWLCRSMPLLVTEIVIHQYVALAGQGEPMSRSLR
jgi:hypothetical protein